MNLARLHAPQRALERISPDPDSVEYPISNSVDIIRSIYNRIIVYIGRDWHKVGCGWMEIGYFELEC